MAWPPSWTWTRSDVRSVHDLRTLIESFASPHDFIKQELRYDDVARGRTLYEVAKWLDGLPALEAWAKEARPSDYLELQIRGFGLLFGADTTKPDKYIIEFVSKHVGRQVSDIQAIYFFGFRARCRCNDLGAGCPIRGLTLPVCAGVGAAFLPPRPPTSSRSTIDHPKEPPDTQSKSIGLDQLQLRSHRQAQPD